MNNKLKRTLPYLRLLRDTPDRQKRNRLQTFPDFVLDDIVEILYNILYRNVNVRRSNHVKSLMKNRKSLTAIVSSHNQKLKRRKLIKSQTGGFIAAILPVLAAVLSSIV